MLQIQPHATVVNTDLLNNTVLMWCSSRIYFGSILLNLHDFILFFRKQLLDERSRFSEEIKNTNRCEKELINCRTQLDAINKRKVRDLYITIIQFFINK